MEFKKHSTRLHLEHFSDLLPVVVAIAESNLACLGALDVEVHIMVPGIADAAVYLHSIEGAMLVGFTAPGLSHRGSQRHLGLVLHYRPSGVIYYRCRPFHLDSHIG